MKNINILWISGLSLMVSLATITASAEIDSADYGVISENTDSTDNSLEVDDTVGSMETPMPIGEGGDDLGNIADSGDGNESENDEVTDDDIDSDSEKGKDKDKDKDKDKKKDNSGEMKAINTLIRLNCDSEQLADVSAYMDCAGSYAQGYQGAALVDVLNKNIINKVYASYSDTFMDQCLAAVRESAKATYNNASPDWYIDYTESAIRCTDFQRNVIEDEDITETIKSLVNILSQ